MFRTRRKSKSPARAALIEAAAALAAAKDRVAELEDRASRLEAVAGDEAAATAALEEVATANVETLSAFAAGAPAPDLDDPDRRRRAAVMARKSMPAVERQIADARAAAVTAEVVHRNALVDVLLEEVGAPIAEQYLQAYRNLCHLHDQLGGIAQVALEHGRDGIRPVTIPIELTRFQIGPLLKTHDGSYSPVLKYENDHGPVEQAATRFRSVARLLAGSPLADLSKHLKGN